MRTLMQIAEDARRSKYAVAKLGTNDKNRGILAIADTLMAHADEIIAANRIDIENGRAAGLNDGLIDRLMLDEKRIAGIAEGCRQVAALPDPVGEVLWMHKRPNGLNIGQKRVPMGVIGIIYEARPNVTVDAAVLCFKAGSACILRGGKEAFQSSMCLTRLMRAALAAEGLPENAINLVEDTSRDTATQMMKLNGYLDVLIPRGGAGLIRSVVMNATVPVIETGTGNCHVYVDATADLEMAKNILVNAKCQRPSVCNAAESLLVHKVQGSALQVIEPIQILPVRPHCDGLGRRCKPDHGLKQIPLPLLDHLTQGVEVSGKLGRDREEAFAVLALGLAEELLPPAAHHFKGRLKRGQQFNGLPLPVQQVPDGCIQPYRVFKGA